MIYIVRHAENLGLPISEAANDDVPAVADLVSNGQACPSPKPLNSNVIALADKADDELQTLNGKQFDIATMAELL